MTGEKDIAAGLPPPPPPSPARREEAIGAALRQFDGADRAASPREERQGRWSLGKPQLGVLVAASLAVVVAVPVALRTFGQQAPPTPAARNTPSQLAMNDTAAPPPPAIVAPPAAPASSSMEAVPDQEKPAPDLAREASPPAAKQAPAEYAAAVPPPAVMSAAPPPPPAAASPMRATAAPGAMAESSSIMVTGRARAPAPQTEPELLGDVVVTARRRVLSGSARASDWEACTILDPRRELGGCRALIDPDAEGRRGSAAKSLLSGIDTYREGDADAALGAFDRAVATTPRSAIAYLNRGLARAQAGDRDGALSDLDKAVEYAPKAARGYYHRSRILRSQGAIARANADRARATALDRRYANAPD